MTAITINVANVIQRALQSPDLKTDYWLSETTPALVTALKEHGMEQTGTAPSPVKSDGPKPFWGIWSVVDRTKAEAALLPFRKVVSPIAFTLTPFEQETHWANYHCPKCNSHNLYFHDGDSVCVPVLPEGLNSYDDFDTSLMVGTCKDCGEPIFFYEFGFTNVTDPDGSTPFCVPNLPQVPDRFQMFKAEADGMEPWIVSRLFFETGKLHRSYDKDARRLPKGPFAVDFHQFGPFSLDREGELSGKYGVARCAGTSSDKWQRGEDLFRNLAANAMKTLNKQEK